MAYIGPDNYAPGGPYYVSPPAGESGGGYRGPNNGDITIINGRLMYFNGATGNWQSSPVGSGTPVNSGGGGGAGGVAGGAGAAAGGAGTAAGNAAGGAAGAAGAAAGGGTWGEIITAILSGLGLGAGSQSGSGTSQSSGTQTTTNTYGPDFDRVSDALWQEMYGSGGAAPSGGGAGPSMSTGPAPAPNETTGSGLNGFSGLSTSGRGRMYDEPTTGGGPYEISDPLRPAPETYGEPYTGSNQYGVGGAGGVYVGSFGGAAPSGGAGPTGGSLGGAVAERAPAYDTGGTSTSGGGYSAYMNYLNGLVQQGRAAGGAPEYFVPFTEDRFSPVGIQGAGAHEYQGANGRAIMTAQTIISDAMAGRPVTREQAASMFEQAGYDPNQYLPELEALGVFGSGGGATAGGGFQPSTEYTPPSSSAGFDPSQINAGPTNWSGVGDGNMPPGASNTGSYGVDGVGGGYTGSYGSPAPAPAASATGNPLSGLSAFRPEGALYRDVGPGGSGDGGGRDFGGIDYPARESEPPPPPSYGAPGPDPTIPPADGSKTPRDLTGLFNFSSLLGAPPPSTGTEPRMSILPSGGLLNALNGGAPRNTMVMPTRSPADSTPRPIGLGEGVPGTSGGPTSSGGGYGFPNGSNPFNSAGSYRPSNPGNGPYSWGAGGASGNRNAVGTDLYGYYGEMANPKTNLDPAFVNSLTQEGMLSARSGFADAREQMDRHVANTGNTAGYMAGRADLGRREAGAYGSMARQNTLALETERQRRREYGLQGLGGLYTGESGYNLGLLGIQAGLQRTPRSTTTTNNTSGRTTGNNRNFNVNWS